MWRSTGLILFGVLVVCQGEQFTPRSGDELVSKVLRSCGDMGCVKENVLEYLDNVLGIQSDVRSPKNIDAAIFKRAARVLDTYEFRMKVPSFIADNTDILYSPSKGLDVATDESANESRGLLKKKLLLPFLLLFKLKKQLLMPIFVLLASLKATKALILSKLSILIVLGFIIYQLCQKSGMPMPMMTMAPAPEPAPAPMYGPPSTPSSYEPSWEANNGGPYARVWTPSNNNEAAQNMAYNAYYPGATASSTARP